MKTNTKRCPFCAEKVLLDAKKCKHCGEWLEKKKSSEKHSSKSLKNSFFLWLITLFVFYLILWLTGFDFSDDTSWVSMAALFADIALGSIFFLLLCFSLVLGLLFRPKKLITLTYLLATSVVFIAFFAILYRVPSNSVSSSDFKSTSNYNIISSSRENCSEKNSLQLAKNCTVLVMRDDGGHGTGFSVVPGYLVTNKHVIEDAKSLTTWINGEKELVLWDYAPTLDIAVLKLPENIPTCQWFDSSALSLAESVFAIGWPEVSGGDSTITRGVFSRLNHIEAGLEFIQTDAAINPGNSGGPLINECGIVGVNTQKEVWSNSNIPLEGLGNALSSKTVQPVIETLIASGGEGTQFPRSKTAYRNSNGGNYSIPTSPIINIDDVRVHLSNIRSVKLSWEAVRGDSRIPQDKLYTLLDSYERQISFCETLISRLSERKSTQDDLIMWDAIVKMSYESASLSAQLNLY